jgi:DNA (cytosine-5)-methyltransferase 1
MDIVAFAQNQRDEVRTMDVAGALAADPGMKQQTYVAFEPGSIARNAGPSDLSETVSTQRADMGDNQPAVLGNMQVRRLTPVECERLQGFPDNYTQTPYRGKPADQCPDGPRYKALGNSMAVPVMRWIGERICNVINGV